MKTLKIKKAFTLIELIIVIAIIAVLAAMSQQNIPHGGRGRASARRKACFSNQRVLQGAIEMYNMDSSIMIHTALPNGDFGDCEELLIREKYLKDYLVPPEEDCAYGIIGLEKPFSYAYLENKKRIQREKEYQKMLDITIRIISSPPFILFAVIFIVSYALTGRKKKKSS